LKSNQGQFISLDNCITRRILGSKAHELVDVIEWKNVHFKTFSDPCNNLDCTLDKETADLKIIHGIPSNYLLIWEFITHAPESSHI